jgi:hypothetical protein
MLMKVECGLSRARLTIDEAAPLKPFWSEELEAFGLKFNNYVIWLGPEEIGWSWLEENRDRFVERATLESIKGRRL